MQISFESHIDHWIALQIFSVEQLDSLRRHDRKGAFKVLGFVVVFLVILNLVGDEAAGIGSLIWPISVGFIFGVMLLFLTRKSRARKMIYQRIKVAYGSESDKEDDRGVEWDVSDDQITIRCAKGSSVHYWGSVKNITVCPDYVFVYFGLSSYAWLARECVSETEYRAFCDNLITKYKKHAAKNEKEALVVNRDWTVDLEELRQTGISFSTKKTVFTILWAIIFLFSWTILLGLILFAIVFCTSLYNGDSEYVERANSVIAMIWLIGSILIIGLGVALGLHGKLPGTKNERKGRGD